MRHIRSLSGAMVALSARLRIARRLAPPLSKQLHHGYFTEAGRRRASDQQSSTLPVAIITCGLFIWWLYPSDDFAELSNKARSKKRRAGKGSSEGDENDEDDQSDVDEQTSDQSAWANFSRRFESLSLMTDLEWSDFSDKLVGYILPEWSKLIPGYTRKLQRELSMSPGSLADEIWQEAHDPLINPEIRYSAEVRVSTDLCDEEKEYLARRRRVALVALAKYLGLEEKDIHPDDVPTVAMCGSGGGLRALIAGTGSLLATEEDGLFDCVTYMSGVSGSCWLQTLYLSSFTKGSISALLEHLKARASTHIAYPPVAFHSLSSLPTSKYLLSGLVEKLKGDPKADFGLVDIYGLLLGARYLVPKGELGVDDRDFKLSNQREYVKLGQRPMPIYTAVRHEIPDLDADGAVASEEAKAKAKQEAWFQWYEITPYEFFCEELGAGIPTWAMGRKFEDGKDLPPENGFHLPEIRVPLLLGIFGSAFCATLSHYYREIRPLVQSLAGFGTIDEMVSERDDDLSKVHPIDPARIPNFAYHMYDKLPKTAPKSIYEHEYIQLMDAGMSNNLPIYPLLRPGRDVDVLIVFDASADIKTDNWLSVADGYARQRGITGWPVGIGWPKPGGSVKQTVSELADAQAGTSHEAERKVQEAKADQRALRQQAGDKAKDTSGEDAEATFAPGDEEAGDLGYCTVWVGTAQERSSEPPPPSTVITHANTFKLMEPEAGIAVVYLPFLSNEKVPGISPGTTEFLSTWNFVYTPEQIDSVVRLARANYDEGKEQIKSTVRAVYERKKQLREQAEKQLEQERYRNMARRGEKALLGQGDQFS
ncbi:Lysophospholipase [Tolypocladium paradoxum]|uniref:Lysophospholipase n=1 Tax=Tolypocladium paradoxum TaxID=94208 RepID=A0A2S4KTX8_9HYPO|nr:Lysophospholipase [Tolypocladium paradoxum]